MRFTISRASDYWRPTRLPDPKVKPHRIAVWEGDDWIVDVKSLEGLLELSDKGRHDHKLSIDVESMHIRIVDDTSCNGAEGL
jgi:hypothetical protein